MKQEVEKWQTLADAGLQSPIMSPQTDQEQGLSVGASAASLRTIETTSGTDPSNLRSKSIPSLDSQRIPMLDENEEVASTGMEPIAKASAQERRTRTSA